MSRYKHVAAFAGVCVVWLSGIAAAQGPPGGITFTGSNSTQVVRVTQTGPGISNPSPTNQPPAALRGEAIFSPTKAQPTNDGSLVGVIGTSDAKFGLGVVGIASGTPTPGSQANPTGVIGLATSTSGNTKGVTGEVFSPDGVAVSAHSTGGRLFEGSNEPPGGPVVGHFEVDGNGNVTTSGTLSLGVVPGISGSTFEVDQSGNTNISGILQATSGNFSGLVSGLNGSFSGNVTTPEVNAVNGNFGGNVTATSGVGSFNSIQAGSGFFGAAVTTGPLSVNGNLIVTGSKSSIAEVSGGRRVALYAVESPENWFEDFGTARLHHGVVRVTIEPVFSETVSPELSYHVFVTPGGNCRGLYIAKKTPAGFEVRELGGGRSNVAFDYRIVARRKGYEKLRLAEVPQPGAVLAESKSAAVSGH